MTNINLPCLIGLTGPSGVGKDYTARPLMALGWSHLKFADGLRHLTYKTHGLNMSYIGNKEYEQDYNVTPLLIETGRIAREVHPGIFVESLLWQIWNRPRAWSCPGIVVSDVRQQNEQDLLTQMGGTVYEVTRDEVARPAQPLDNLLDRTKLPKLPSGSTLVGSKPMKPNAPLRTDQLANLYSLAGHPSPWELLEYLRRS